MGGEALGQLEEDPGAWQPLGGGESGFRFRGPTLEVRGDPAEEGMEGPGVPLRDPRAKLCWACRCLGVSSHALCPGLRGALRGALSEGCPQGAVGSLDGLRWSRWPPAAQAWPRKSLLRPLSSLLLLSPSLRVPCPSVPLSPAPFKGLSCQKQWLGQWETTQVSFGGKVLPGERPANRARRRVPEERTADLPQALRPGPLWAELCGGRWAAAAGVAGSWGGLGGLGGHKGGVGSCVLAASTTSVPCL